MEKLISCCGIDCAQCDARIATLSGDALLREQTAEKWRVQYNSPGITAEMINCTGCRQPGAKFSHCSQCQIRKCADEKGYQTCAECDQMETCETVGMVFKFLPETRENLKSIR
ncbi:MAG: DUF3795 domain-containing protein [Syntrophothermus sp.]